jgi:hypothetical protein
MNIPLTQEGPVILIGYEYRLHIAAEAPVFVEGPSYTGQVRAHVSAPDVLATLRSDAGGITRISDTVLEISLQAAQTALLSPGRIVLDLVRIDLIPGRHLGFVLEIPVALPVTRGL